MKKSREVTVTRTVILCNRCGNTINEEPNRFGFKEHLSLSFRAGPNSTYKEGTLVECDLCSACISKVLDKYLILSRDLLFEITHLC